MPESRPTITTEDLTLALSSTAAAFRVTSDLEPAGGPSDKVFPPTYEGGEYALEQRIIDGQRVPCVLLDSVQSRDLALAAGLHDVGKADFRFQVLLHGGDEIGAAAADKPLAKSLAPAPSRQALRRALARSHYPAGGRHELQSVAMIQSAPAILERAHDCELVLHLIGTHHGFTRPLAPVVDDDSPVEVTAGVGAGRATASSNHRLHELDSDVADRFWRLTRRYGWWGLAYLEAVVRLADRWQSQMEQEP